MNIVLFGPPGAGKGTQANNMVKKFNLFKVSTGDLLREEIKNNTNLGTKIKSTVNAGILVSDDIIDDLMAKVRHQIRQARLLRDGRYRLPRVNPVRSGARLWRRLSHMRRSEELQKPLHSVGHAF